MAEEVTIVEPKLSITLKDYSDNYDFTVLGRKLSLSRDIVVTCHAKTDFIRYAEYLTERFLTDVAKFDSFDSFYTNINDCAQTVLNSAVSAMIKMLVSNGIFTIDEAIFRAHLSQQDWKAFLGEIKESHQFILEKEAHAQGVVDKTKNSYRKADTRPEYYGIGGSTSKAYMKSAMGAIGASIVGSMQESALKKELEGAKEFLMNDQEFIADMCQAFAASVMEIGSWGLTFLGISVKDALEQEKQAMAVFNNIKHIEDEEQIKSLLGSCLIGMPLHLEVYQYISDHFTNPQDRGDLDKVMELLRVNQHNRDIDIEDLTKSLFAKRADYREKAKEEARKAKIAQNKAWHNVAYWNLPEEEKKKRLWMGLLLIAFMFGMMLALLGSPF